MDNVILVIVTALISGLLATLITLWWQQRAALRARKMKVFETLMAYRYMITAQESVNALNSIDVVFYKDKEVRRAFSDFLNEAGKKPEFGPNTLDKHLKLLEEMSKALGMKDIHWDNIKQAYYPAGLAEKIEEETALRKIQIQNEIETAQRNQSQKNTPTNKQFNEQYAMQILPELIKNPESLKLLMELGKASKK